MRKLTGTLVEDGMESLPARAAGLAAEGLSAAGVLGRLVTMPADPPTVFKGPLHTAKRCAWSEILPFDQVKAFSKTAGATINDLLLTGVAGALRRYIIRRGGDTRGLNIRAVIPVNLRPDDAYVELGNRFGLVFLSLPVGIVDWRERLAELKQRMDAIKGSTEAVVSFAVLQALGTASPEIEGVAVGIFGSKATAVMTNVPGPRKEIYLAGKPVRSLMFWVPQSARLGLGVSILSYAGQVRLGIATDAVLAPDPGAIIEAFQEEMYAMLGIERNAAATA
jgi:diacylglycerol O-acyltransferase / wax synthase